MDGMRHMSPMIITSVVAGVILTILAPYGTYQMPVVWRAVFWIGLCFAGGVGASTAEALLRQSPKVWTSWQRVLCQSLGATLAVWICFLGLQIVQQGKPNAFFFTVMPFYIWIIAAIICTVGELMRRKEGAVIATDTAVRPAIIERLKPALRNAEIYALSAEDHYVRVHTSKGDDLILMRLSDAIKETAPLIGLSTHRSWWVSETGVKSVQKQNGKINLVLHSGIEAPVSRNNAKTVREAGWV